LTGLRSETTKTRPGAATFFGTIREDFAQSAALLVFPVQHPLQINRRGARIGANFRCRNGELVACLSSRTGRSSVPLVSILSERTA
jgi:hypothetical protein